MKRDKIVFREKEIKMIVFILLICSIIFIFWDFLIGKKYFMFHDVGSDTIYQYYPYYVNCVNRLKEGTFGIWNWDYGLGTSLLNNLGWTLDPYGILTIILGIVTGADKIKYFLVIVQILKIISAFFLCRHFLKIFQVSELAAGIGACLYGLNSYLLLWGQHYFLGTSCIYMILVLIFIEKSIRSTKLRYSFYLAVTVAASIIYSYYIAYMILIFSAIYYLFRVFEIERFSGWKKKIYILIKGIVTVISGILISGIVLLPAANYILTGSSRLDSDVSLGEKIVSSFWDTFSIHNIVYRLSRMMSNNLLGINESIEGWANYYEMPSMCFSILIFILVCQYVVWIFKLDRKRMFYHCAVIIMSIFGVLSPMCGLIFNGFAYPSFRYTFVIFPVLAILFCKVWDYCIFEANISILGLIFGGMISGAVLLYSYTKASGEVKNYSVVYSILIYIYIYILLKVWRKKQITGGGMAVIIGIIFISISIEGYITNNDRGVLDKQEFFLEFENGILSNDTTKALEYLDTIDKSIYRVEKTYTDWNGYGDSLMEGYSTVTCYNSTLNRNISDFYNNIYINSNINRDMKVFVIENDLDICAISLANVKYILSKDELAFEWCELLQKIGDVFIYRNNYTENIAKWYTITTSKAQYEQADLIDKRDILMSSLVVDENQNAYYSRSGNKCLINQFMRESQNSIRGSICNSEKGILMLAIPDQPGWKIYVDGKLTETINADYGFIGIELDSGEHEILAKYSIPYMKAGMAMSGSGFVVMAGMLIFLRQKSKWTNEEIRQLT